MLSKVLIVCVKMYQKFISPIKPKRIKCRFYPTCSLYAVLAIRKYGAIKGIKMTISRLNKCNPHNRDSCIDYP